MICAYFFLIWFFFQIFGTVVYPSCSSSFLASSSRKGIWQLLLNTSNIVPSAPFCYEKKAKENKIWKKIVRGVKSKHILFWRWMDQGVLWKIVVPKYDSEDYTAHKMKFSIEDFLSKCDQIRRKLRIWSRLLKKFLMENFIFCAVLSSFVTTSCAR